VPNQTLVTRRNGRILISGNSQYQNDTEAMKGEIFAYDYCQQLGPDEFPDNVDKLRIFMGVDLAITQHEDADKFAIVVLGITPDRSQCFFLDHFEGHLRFTDQTRKIIEFVDRWDPIRVGLETNQYQEAQKQVLEDAERAGKTDIRLKGFQTDVDKRQRAWKRSAWFEDKRMFFRRSNELLIEHFVLFTGKKGTACDTFDAFDLAMRAMEKKSRRRRKAEPGIF
jgi:phage terminase large subunit-like protein